MSTPVQAVKRVRAKTGNHVALSLNRMARVKGNATAWLKGFEKMQARSTTPVSVHFDTRPVSTQLHVFPPSACSTKSTTHILSPLAAWTPSEVPAAVHYVCSFCTNQERHVAHVRYNAMLPLPYVLLCSECAHAQ